MELCFIFLFLLFGNISAQDGCSSDFCNNGGVCVKVLGSLRCACPDDTTGSYCEFLLPDSTRRTTTPTTTTTTTSTTTTTPTTTTTTPPTTTSTTTTLATTMPVCNDEFCMNSGVCVPVLGRPVCACPEGISGTHCEVSPTTPTTTAATTTTPTTTTTTPTTTMTTTTTTTTTSTTTTPLTTAASCTADFCQNRGVCVPVLGRPVCACPEGVTGKHCELLPLCTPDFCVNNGVCVVVLGRPVCACPEGVTGAHCEASPHDGSTVATTDAAMTDTTTESTTEAMTTSSVKSTTETAATSSVSTACDNNPCLFGGSCTPLLDGGFECNCPSGSLPPFCLPIAAQTTDTTTTTPVATTTAMQCDTTPFDGCGKAEVVFMITYAGQEDGGDIDHEGDFIKELIRGYQIDNNHIRVGVVVYHDDASEAVKITQYAGDKSGLYSRVDTLTEQRRHNLTPSGKADVARALTFVKDNSFKNARPGAKKVLIPIIHMVGNGLDFNSSYPAAVEAAMELKIDCVQIFTQSVERDLQNYLYGSDIVAKIATAPTAPYYNKFHSFDDLEDSAHNYHPQCRQ